MIILLLSIYPQVSEALNLKGKIGMNDYEINELETYSWVKGIEKGWALTYNGNKIPATVIKRKTTDGTEYIVQCRFFEVSYACTKKGFGAKNVKKAWSSVPPGMSRQVINQEQLKRQEIITPEKIDDEYALGLIAGFLPDLINDKYRCFILT